MKQKFDTLKYNCMHTTNHKRQIIRYNTDHLDVLTIFYPFRMLSKARKVKNI